MADLAASDLTYTIQTERKGGVRPVRQNVVKVTFGDGTLTYPSGGIPFTNTKLGLPEGILESLDLFDSNDAVGTVWKYDFANNKLRGFATQPARVTGVIDDNDNAATLGHALYVLPVAMAAKVPVMVLEASGTGLVIDSDNAATEGVIVYVVVDDANFSTTFQLGHLEFVSPTNANGTCTIANGAATLTLFDDDAAATNGVACRCVAASGNWEATTSAEKDIIVPVSTGRYLFINHATTGSTPTIYFDEDASNTYDRLRAVMVDNANEPYALYVESGAEVRPDVPDRSSQLATIVTVGPKPFTYAVGSGGPTILVASRPDAATVAGAVGLFVKAANAGFNAATYNKRTVYVPTSDGSFIDIAYAASPTGVQCYGFPEGASTDLTILGVIADNADENFYLSRTLGMQIPGALVELTSGVDAPVAQTVFCRAVGY